MCRKLAPYAGAAARSLDYDGRMSRFGPALVSAVCALSLAAPLSASADHWPTATAAKTCDIGSVERKLGPTYVTSLTATGTSCGAAKRLVKAFHACRKAHGGVKGHCTNSVQGYRCKERRSTIPTQFSSKVTCTKSGSKVVHTYTQFT